MRLFKTKWGGEDVIIDLIKIVLVRGDGNTCCIHMLDGNVYELDVSIQTIADQLELIEKGRRDYGSL